MLCIKYDTLGFISCAAGDVTIKVIRFIGLSLKDNVDLNNWIVYIKSKCYTSY